MLDEKNQLLMAATEAAIRREQELLRELRLDRQLLGVLRHGLSWEFTAKALGYEGKCAILTDKSVLHMVGSNCIAFKTWSEIPFASNGCMHFERLAWLGAKCVPPTAEGKRTKVDLDGMSEHLATARRAMRTHWPDQTVSRFMKAMADSNFGDVIRLQIGEQEPTIETELD